MFIEKMLQIMERKKITKKKMCSDLGIGINQIKYWQDHNNIPSGDVVSKIAQYLDVSIDYLLADDSSEKNDDISKQKKELLDRIAGLTDEQAREVQEIVDYILEKKKRE